MNTEFAPLITSKQGLYELGDPYSTGWITDIVTRPDGMTEYHWSEIPKGILEEKPKAIWDSFYGPEHLGSLHTDISTDKEEVVELAKAKWPELTPLRVARRPIQ